MIETIKRLVENKEEIVTEDKRTVKMFVPMSFDLVDGKCVNPADQELFDFLTERDDVLEETEEYEEEAQSYETI